MPSPLQRWLIMLLASLLALGPFLHGHLGNSHQSGFHLDGMHALHADDGSVAAMASPSGAEEESEALGVGDSLPPSTDPGLPLLLCGLLFALLALSLLSRLACPLTPPLRTGPRTLYRPGLPPPGLAPPRV
jgi:hypothetical protein